MASRCKVADSENDSLTADQGTIPCAEFGWHHLRFRCVDIQIIGCTFRLFTRFQGIHAIVGADRN